jgi:hypothetical protein
MPGMLVIYPPSASAYLESAEGPFTGLKVRVVFRHTEQSSVPYEGTRPDLTDPATLGCLLALVREALKPRGWGVTLCLANTGAGWQLGYLAGGEWFSPLGTIHRSEAEALVAALEAAQ